MNSSIWPIDGALTGDTNAGQSGLESNGNEGVLHIPQAGGGAKEWRYRRGE